MLLCVDCLAVNVRGRVLFVVCGLLCWCYLVLVVGLFRRLLICVYRALCVVCC